MKSVVRQLAVAALCLLAVAAPASAQYMYLDSNGDGVHTVADRMNANGTATSVTAYIDTDSNRDGSPGVCLSGDPVPDALTINSYVINLDVVGGTATFGNFANLRSEMATTLVAFNSGSDFMEVGQGGGTVNPAGTYALCTFDVTGATGAPSLAYAVVRTDFTSFGAQCFGNDFDNTLKYTTDWSDADGLGPAPGGNQDPVITALTTVSGAENSPVTVNGSAVDPDGDNVTLSQTTNAPFLSGPSMDGPSLNPSIALTGTPNFDQAGTYTVNWTAVDDATTPGTATAVTSVVIAQTDRLPALATIAAINVAEGSTASTPVSASDADGDIITLTTLNLPVFATLQAPTTGTGSVSTNVSASPNFTQAGTYTPTIRATANGQTVEQTFSINVSNTNRNPILAAIAPITVDEGASASTPVSATDADNELITLTASLPAFAALDAPTSGTGSVSTTVTASPGFADAGSYPSSVTATDASSGTDTENFTITVNNVDRPVALAPIANVTIGEGSTDSRNVNATDPDGDVVEVTAVLPSFATLNPPTTGPGSVSTTIAFAPVSGDQGSYTGEVTATSLATTDVETFSITVTQTNQVVVLDPIADLTVQEGSTAFRSITASDADGDAITLTATLPSFATLQSPTTGTGSVSTSIVASPGFADAGTYASSITATDGIQPVTQNFDIIVENLDRPVILDPIADINVNEGATASTGVSASDPDGETITLIASLPPFATLDAPTSGAGSVTTTVTASPASGDAGSYPSSVTASAGGASDTENFTINVADVDQPPSLDPIADIDVQEGSSASTAINASDPDGDLITLSASGLPSFATLDAPTSGTGSVSTTVTASPASGDAGSYPVSITATALTLSDTQSFSINVTEPNEPPTIGAPATASVDEGQNLNFLVTASDPNSDPLTVTMSGAPSGASLTNNNDGTWTFDWTPGFNDAGVYPVVFTANDGRGGTASATTEVTVNNVNRCPTANAGGPYTGVINVPVNFNGAGSSDPDGDALTYTWTFGDGSGGSGPTPSHAYTNAGTYTVNLAVGDGICEDNDETTATIASEIAANAFTSGGNNTTRLWAGKPTTCVQIEPVGGSFQLSDVDFATIRMVSAGTGSVSEIFALAGKTSVDGDRNHNGVSEIAACFSKDDLRLLFDGLPAGPNTVIVEIFGDLTGGGSFRATLEHRVLSRGGGVLAASVSPNPLNPEGMLSFATTQAGRVRVAVFDLNGRLVKTLLDEFRAAGSHDVAWNGTRADGRRVASGVYFFRIESSEGRVVRSVTVLK